MRRILNDHQMVTRGNCKDGLHIAGLPSKVHWNNRLCAWRDGVFYAPDINVERFKVNVDEDRNSVDRKHGSGCGDESVGRNDHFVAGPNSQGLQSNLNRPGTVGTGDTVSRAVKAGKRFLELRHLRTFITGTPIRQIQVLSERVTPPVTASKHLKECPFLRLVEDRPGRERLCS